MDKIKITVWTEHNQDQFEPVRSVYPEGMHTSIAGAFREDDVFDVTIATQDMPGRGLGDGVLENTDVLVWWSHLDNARIDDELVTAVCERVLNGGMGLVVLHAALFSKPWQRLMGTYGDFPGWGRYRTSRGGELQRLWVVARDHPITEGLPDSIEIPRDEMYGEPLLMPEPDRLLFLSWWQGGEVNRSGALFERGRGKVFLFTPGHEEFPIYDQPEIRQILRNAGRFMAPSPYLRKKARAGLTREAPSNRSPEGLQDQYAKE